MPVYTKTVQLPTVMDRTHQSTHYKQHTLPKLDMFIFTRIVTVLCARKANMTELQPLHAQVCIEAQVGLLQWGHKSQQSWNTENQMETYIHTLALP